MNSAKSKKLNILGQLLLFLATLAWGTSFFILKETIKEVPAFYVIAIRFLFAGVVLLLIFVKKLKKLDKSTFIAGVVLGLTVAAAYMTQTIGLMNTTPGRNAFLTASYCVMCPFLMWFICKNRPKLYNVISAVICIVGIGLISLSGDSGTVGNIFLGDGLTLISAVFFALQIIFIDKFQKKGCDTLLTLIFEFLTVGVFFIISSLIFELPVNGIKGYALNLEQGLKIGYLAVMCTLFAQSAQMIGQKYTKPNQSAIILSLESVFGMLFSVMLGAEQLSIMLGIGFGVVFIAILISELKLDPVKLLARRAKNQSPIGDNNKKDEEV